MLAKYIRLSDQDGDCRPGEKAESNSVVNQRALLDHFIASHLEFAGRCCLEFLDDGHTGTNFDRPGVQALFAAVRRGEINCILVKDLSRFGRDSLEVGEYLERLFPLLQVRFIAINDGYDSEKRPYGTAGDLDIGVRNLINELYSRNVSVNAKTAKRQYAARGECIAAYPFYGYVKSAADRRKLEIDPPAAEIVRMVFDLWLEGYSTADIANILNIRDVPSPSVRKQQLGAKRSWNRRRDEVPWTQTAVRIILKNERYTGKLISIRTTRAEIGRLKQRTIPQEDWIVVPDAFAAIVTEDEFQRAQSLFRISAPRRPPQYAAPPLFAKKVFCGVCGLALAYHNTAHPYYRCNAPKWAGLEQCKNVRVSEDVLEAFVLGKLLERHEKQDSSDEDTDSPQVRIAALEQKIEKLWSAKKDSFVKWNDGLISLTEYEHICSEKQQEIQRLRMEIEKVERMSASVQQTKNEYSGKLSAADTKELTREMVEAMIQAVQVFDDGRTEIKWAG